ncbi:hypothetical protein BJX64DRAFT_147876 [Aspergillus heterothallicus]
MEQSPVTSTQRLLSITGSAGPNSGFVVVVRFRSNAATCLPDYRPRKPIQASWIIHLDSSSFCLITIFMSIGYNFLPERPFRGKIQK